MRHRGRRMIVPDINGTHRSLTPTNADHYTGDYCFRAVSPLALRVLKSSLVSGRLK